MKLTDMKTEDLVTIVAEQLSDSVIDDSPDDIREHIMDLETGKTKPICTWTREELLEDIANTTCFGCENEVTVDTAYVTDDDSRDLVCRSCHDD